MSASESSAEVEQPPRARPATPRSRQVLRLLAITAARAWQRSVFSESAKAAFWQILAMPPLLLTLLGSLGYLGDWFGRAVVDGAVAEIIDFSRSIFSEVVVEELIVPTVAEIFTVGQAHIVSVGVIIALVAGSSAMAAFIDSVTAAHDQQGVRGAMWQRVFALLVYVGALVVLLIMLPLVALGPGLLTDLLPAAWQSFVATWIGTLYYPGLSVLLILGLATFYTLALPHRLPWYRSLPGAGLATLVFLVASAVLRNYLTGVTATGFTYGAVAAPIAFLLFAFFLALAVIAGAHFNNATDELWPAQRGPRGPESRLRERGQARRLALRDAEPGSQEHGGQEHGTWSPGTRWPRPRWTRGRWPRARWYSLEEERAAERSLPSEPDPGDPGPSERSDGRAETPGTPAGTAGG